MSQPLVLRLGRIAEETPAEAGAYPRLRVVAGRLVAGGAGTDLVFVGGRVAQFGLPGAEYVDVDYWDADYADGS